MQYIAIVRCVTGTGNASREWHATQLFSKEATLEEITAWGEAVENSTGSDIIITTPRDKR